MEGDRARHDNLLLQSSKTQLSTTLLKEKCSQMAIHYTVITGLFADFEKCHIIVNIGSFEPGGGGGTP